MGRAREVRFLDRLRCLDGLGLGEGWLVMFDLRSTLPWDERLSTRVVEAEGKRVTIARC